MMYTSRWSGRKRLEGRSINPTVADPSATGKVPPPRTRMSVSHVECAARPALLPLHFRDQFCQKKTGKCFGQFRIRVEAVLPPGEVRFGRAVEMDDDVHGR